MRNRLVHCLALALTLLTPLAWGGSNAFYAKLTAKVADTGGGQVYASKNVGLAPGSFSAEGSTDSMGTGTSSGEVTIYAFAKPNDGNRFVGWSDSSSSANTIKSYALRWAGKYTAQKASGWFNTGGRGEGNATIYTTYGHFEQIEPAEIHLCVGDVLVLNYDIAGGTTKEKYAQYQATGDGSIVSVAVAGQGASTGSDGEARQRGCTLTVTALEPGSQEIRLQKQNEANNIYGDYDILKVVVDEERRVKRGSSVTVEGLATSVVSSGNAAWTAPASSATGIATGAYTAQATTSAAVTVTGVEAGRATITAKNVKGGASTAWAGAEYRLRVDVYDPTTIPVTLSQGASIVLPSVYDGESATGIEQASSCKVTAALNGSTVTFDAARASVGVEERFSLRGAEGLFLVYKITVVDPLVLKPGESKAGVAANMRPTWDVESTDATIATIAGTGSGANHNATIAAVAVGDAVCRAVNAAPTEEIGHYAYLVQVRETRTKFVDVPIDTAVDVTLGTDGSTPGVWQMTAAPNTQVATVALGGGSASAGQVTATVTGKKVGETSFTASNEYITENVTVRVVKGLRTGEYEIAVGADLTIPDAFGTISSDTSSNPDAAVVTVKASDKIVIHGVGDGTTLITLECSDFTARYTVHVHATDIYQTIQLALGANSTRTTYTASYDALVAMGTPSVAGLIDIVQTENTVKYIARAKGTTQLDVTVHVDGYDDNTVMHYTFEVEDYGNRGVVDYKDGYVIYENASAIQQIGDDLLFTFDHPSQASTLEIPTSYRATFDALAVAGGGAGGSQAGFGWGGGGGGAGGFVELTEKTVSEGVYAISVGQGGRNTATRGVAEKGAKGGDSSIVSAAGITVIKAAGGGGGAASGDVSMSSGAAGGSGGGAAWFDGLAGLGGAGIGGQGDNGGVPTDYNAGAGGGGASAVGGDDGSRGAGRTSDISGAATLYAVGGLGGRSDSTSAAAAGDGPGFGGDGGNGGPGGAGGDGVVYVRLTDLYSTIKVPIPTTEDLLTLRHLWENGKTCTAIAYSGKTFRSSTDGRPYQWEDVLASVEGDNSVTCGAAGAGIGYYNVVVALKEGFVWEDGTDENRRFRWTIVADLDTDTADLDARKTVSWQDAENAVIQIEASASPEKTSAGVVKKFDLTFDDTVVASSAGLDIQEVTLKISTQSAASGWTDVLRWTCESESVETIVSRWNATMAVDPSSNKVSVRVPNIGADLWTRMEIKVRDNGIFRTNIGATLNEKTGLYEKNPNAGAVQVVMTDESGNVKKVTCEAETDVPWRYVAYPIEASVTGGEIFIGGTKYNPYALYEGANLPVYYRGLGGYKLKSVKVDGLPVAITEITSNRYDFISLDAPHEIDVEYVRFYGQVSTSPNNLTYDGRVHVFPVTLTNWDPDYSTQVKYALSMDASDDEYYTEEEFAKKYAELKNVGTHVFAYRVYAWQQGYGESLTDPGWAWVNTGRQGTGTVTINPAPLYVQPNYKHLKTSDKSLPVFDYSIQGLVNNETTNVIVQTGWSAYTIYEMKAEEAGLYPIYMKGVKDLSINGNYQIHLLEGGLAVYKDTVALNSVHQIDSLGPDDGEFNTGVDPVGKVYDGLSAKLTFNVTFPEESNKYTIKYSMDDRKTWSGANPDVKSVGKYKVWYAFEPTQAGKDTIFASTNYQYITISPRTIKLTSASATKTYDGEPLTAATVVESGEGRALTDTFTYTFGEGQTMVGAKPNAFAYAISGVGKEADYAITVETGTLTVTAGKMTIGGVEQPDNPNRPLDQGKTGVADVVKEYDGLPTNLVVQVDQPASGCTVKFTTTRNDPTSWKSSLAFVEIGEYIVYYTVEAANYASVTNFGRVIIKERNVQSMGFVDHRDAGGGKVYLAFKPATREPLTVDYVKQLAAEGRIKIVYGQTEPELSSATPKTVPLRDPKAELDVEKGWIWITIDPFDPALPKQRPLLWKVVID